MRAALITRPTDGDRQSAASQSSPKVHRNSPGVPSTHITALGLPPGHTERLVWQAAGTLETRDIHVEKAAPRFSVFALDTNAGG